MPYKILKKRTLCTNIICEMILDTPLISKKAHAGNFIIIRINEAGERIPLTIADYNRKEGTITIVFQIVGKSTKLLSTLNEGDDLLDVVGPLGNKIHIKNYENPVVIIGGGVGIAPCYPQAKELKEAGNKIIFILGARSSELLFWKEKSQAVCDELIICTDDGSEGIKGVVTDPLKEIIKREAIDLVIAIGPLIMMKFVALTTEGKTGLPKVDTMVSLNTIMVDGTGMCGGCRFITKEGKTYFACVDGPDVDGHTVDFENLLQRAKIFSAQETQSLSFDDQNCKALNNYNRNT